MSKPPEFNLPTYAAVVGVCVDEYLPTIRELMSYDAICEVCNPLKRDVRGLLSALPASPLHISRQTEYPWAVVESELNKDHIVLDVSSGHSVLKYALANRVRHVVCSEYESNYMLTVQKTLDNHKQRTGLDNITLIHADARKLPYCDNWFDRIFCISVLEHINDDPLVSIKEMIRILKPGGILMLSFDIALDKAGEGNNFYMDRKSFNNVLQYFEISKIYPCNINSNPITFTTTLEKVPLLVFTLKYTKNTI